MKLKIYFFLCLSTLCMSLDREILQLHTTLEMLADHLQTPPSLFTEQEIVARSIIHNCPIIQLAVKNQFDSDGGGNASCGYHGLKNSYYIVRSLIAPLKEKSVFINNLKSTPLVIQLFGVNPAGIWRTFIINKRKQTGRSLGNPVAGDWLFDDEIEALAQTQLNLAVNALFTDKGIAVISDVSLLENPLLSSSEFFIELLRALADPTQNLIYSFVIGDMTQRGNDPLQQSPGHWVSLVLHKDQTTITFYVANSAANHSLIGARPIISTINFLLSGVEKLEIRTALFNALTNYIKDLQYYLFNENHRLPLLLNQKDHLLKFLRQLPVDDHTLHAVKKFLAAQDVLLQEAWENLITASEWDLVMKGLINIKKILGGPQYQALDDDDLVLLEMYRLKTILENILNNISIPLKDAAEKMMQNIEAYKNYYDQQKELISYQPGKEKLINKSNILKNFLTAYKELSRYPVASEKEKENRILNFTILLKEFTQLK